MDGLQFGLVIKFIKRYINIGFIGFLWWCPDVYVIVEQHFLTVELAEWNSCVFYYIYFYRLQVLEGHEIEI